MVHTQPRAMSVRKVRRMCAIVALTGLAMAGCAAPHLGAGTGVVPLAGARPLTAAVSVSLPADVFSLAFDPARDAVWYPVMTPYGPSTLYEMSARTGKVEAHFALPATTGDGLVSSTRVAADGDVWVSEPYRLVRVDPSTATVTSVDLSVSVPGAEADPNAALPGTWIAAMTIATDSVLVARNNVPFLEQWSLDMKPMADVPIPSGASRTFDMITGHDGILATVAGGSGARVVPVPFQGDKASVLGLQPSSLKVQQGNVALLSPTGTPLLTVDPLDHAADWATVSGTHELIPWPAQTIDVGPPPDVHGAVGTTVKTFTEPSLSAALVTPAGSLWLVKSTETATILEEYLPG